MSTTLPRQARRQVLGKRMGLEPYYTVAESTDTRFILRSRPGANVRAGRIFMGCGSLLALLSISLFCLSYTSSMEDFSAFFSGMILAWPCGVVGGLGVIGGLAIAKTVNTITVDASTRTITYMQKARRERTQVLSFDQIASVRLSPQLFTPPGFIRRPQYIFVLEFVTHEDNSWLIDSAMDSDVLLPVAEAIEKLVPVAVNLQNTHD